MDGKIKRVGAREILSGTGRPTIEARLETDEGGLFIASVPSGSSTGKYEAYELHDGGNRYGGCGVLQAVAHVNEIIAPALVGKSVLDYRAIDRCLIELDGTPNKRRLGANAILAVSLAAARAGAAGARQPLYTYLGGAEATALPIPIATVIAGGKHSPSPLDFEDYLVIPCGFDTFGRATEALVATRVALEHILRERFGQLSEIGTAFAPPVRDTAQAFDLMLEAISRAGYAGRINLGLDVVGSELCESDGSYRVAGCSMEPDQLVEYFASLVLHYPLHMIEDPFDQDDMENTAQLTQALPKTQIVGDDLYATNIARLKSGIAACAGNGLLIKINQSGTVSEAIDVAHLAQAHGMSAIVSARSSETDDAFIADLAVAIGAQQIKLGAPTRGERVAKYNRLLGIEQELGVSARFAGSILPGAC